MIIKDSELFTDKFYIETLMDGYVVKEVESPNKEVIIKKCANVIEACRHINDMLMVRSKQEVSFKEYAELINSFDTRMRDLIGPKH